MKQQEFIKQLRKQLNGLPQVEIEDIVRDQEEFIREAIAAGREEESVVLSLGSADELAKNLKAHFKIEQAQDEQKLGRQVRGAFGAVGALLVLAPFNLIFVLGPFCGLLGVTIAGWAVAFVMSLVSVLMMCAFFAEIIFVSSGVLAHLSTFFTFLGFMGMAYLFLVGMYFSTKFIVRITLSYLKWNLNFIKNQA